jgi:hypothetical protein
VFVPLRLPTASAKAAVAAGEDDAVEAAPGAKNISRRERKGIISRVREVIYV